MFCERWLGTVNADETIALPRIVSGSKGSVNITLTIEEGRSQI
jgi:hypothetical protein